VLGVVAVEVLLFIELMAGPAASEAAAEDEVEDVPFLGSLGESGLAAVGAHGAGGVSSKVLFLEQFGLVASLVVSNLSVAHF
jgi:hypothetical protein